MRKKLTNHRRGLTYARLFEKTKKVKLKNNRLKHFQPFL